MRISTKQAKLTPFAIALAYATLGGLWTFFSDTLYALLANGSEISHKSVAVSHWLFIAMSAVLLYWLLRIWDVAIKSSQGSLHQANKALRTISEGTKAITRIDDEQSLMQEICRIFVTIGGYKFAWVGLAEHDEQKKVLPVAHWGEDESYIHSLQVTWGDDPTGRGPAGSCIRTGATKVFDDIRTNQEFLPWREKALKFGFASGIALPLRDTKEVLGVLVIFSDKKGDFDQEEISRMEELVDDLSYGVRTIRNNIERKNALAERLLLASVMDQTTDGVITLDTKGRIQYINQSFVELCGVPASEGIGVSIHDFECCQRNRDFYEALNYVLTEQKARKGHFINKNRAGSQYDIDVLIVPVFDSKGKVVRYVATIRDVTSEVGLQRQLRQAQKMEAIATLSGGIAHDFNNILAIIITNAEMALEDIAPQHPSHGPVKTIHNAGLRGKNLVKQIIALSRRKEQERQAVRVDRIVDECFNLLRSSLPRNIDLQKQSAKNLGMIAADPTQIHQVIMNLCTNAADAIGDSDGQLSVELSEAFQGAAEVAAYPGLSPGHFIELRVSDSGHGIERDVLDKIFNPFFTTKTHGKGSGLGLSVVHNIVKNHGGAITVTSVPGKGTSFRLLFPRIAGTGEQREEKELPASDTGHERILCVDDEEDYVTAQKKLLERMGYQVVASTDSCRALELFREAPDQFDLVITDQTMPVMNGSRLAAEILKVRPEIPVLLCSGSSPETNIAIMPEKATAIGIREVLLKPVAKQQLGLAIRRHLSEPGGIIERKTYGQDPDY